MECGDFRDILESKRVDLIAGLHMERTFLFDYLRSKSVFDSGDCELFMSEKTREKKAGKFLDVLSTKGEDGFRHFIDAVQLSNPALFETITGEQAINKPNPIMSLLKKGSVEDSYIPDLDIMTNHLQRAYTDLNDITLNYQQVTKEKKALEKSLVDAMSDIQTLQKHIEQLEKEKSENASDAMSSLSSVNNEKESAVQQMQTLQSDLQERNTYIIALHMHLLTAQEKIGNLKNRLHDAEEAKNKMQSELNLVTMNYDHQRHESIKLSEKLEFHRTDLENYNALKMNYRELQFNIQKLKIERDEAQSELNTLKEWTEVFKARYDIVEKDKEQTRESHESIAADCYRLRQRVDELELKVRSQARELESYKKRHSEALEEIGQLKHQRDTLSESRKEIMIERDRFQTDLHQAVERYSELLKNRDDTITRQTNHCKHYEDKYEKKCAELLFIQQQLTSKEHDMEELRRVKFERELSIEDPPCPPMPKVTLPEINDALKHFEEDVLSSVGDGSPEESQCSDDSFDWKLYRKTTKIIESLKKRLGKDRKEDGSPSPSSMKQRGSKNPDRILEELVPQKKALSPEAQKSLSMERNNIFKVTPAHATLACMFDSIAGPSGSTINGRNLKVDSAVDFVENSQRLEDSVIWRKASSDSGISNASNAGLTANRQLQSKAMSETWSSPALAAQTPYFQSVSSSAGISRPVLRKCFTEPINQPNVFTFAGAHFLNEESFDLETVLQSPSFRKPFRQRAMAVRLKDNERPRSSSAPPDSPSLIHEQDH